MLSKMLQNITDVKAGNKTVESIVRCRLEILNKENPKVNAVVEHHKNELIKQAKEIDEQVKNQTCGMLAGAIITVKDNLDVKDHRSTAGIEKLKNNIAKKDCDIVAKLRHEGAIILGKTNMPPGAMDVQTDNPVYGRTNHPMSHEHTCGGSSGGGACAVKLGISDIDIGNDLMGSIRIPSHFCGVYGFIPTENAIYLDIIIGGTLLGSTISNMMRIGFQTNNIKNIEYILPIVLDKSYPSVHIKLPKSLNIGWSDNCGGLLLSQSYQDIFHSFRKKLSSSHKLCEISELDFDFNVARECYLDLLYGNIASTLPSPIYFLLNKILGKKKINRSLKRYLTAENKRNKCIRQLDSILEKYDCLILPVTATPAFIHQKPDRYEGIQPIYNSFDIDGAPTSYAEANLGYTTPISLTSNPVITLPIGKTPDGLPIGVQVVGKRYNEQNLLEIAAKFMQ